MSTEKINLDIHKILTLLPHRYPILLVDRVLELEPHKSIKALKNVTINEPFFIGHFPNRPVMPGVLILEALAQTAALLTFSEEPHDPANTLYLFVGIDNARFKRVVEPGDQLILNVTFERYIRGIWKFKARAEVDGEVAAEAELMCAVRQRMRTAGRDGDGRYSAEGPRCATHGQQGPSRGSRPPGQGPAMDSREGGYARRHPDNATESEARAHEQDSSHCNRRAGRTARRNG